MKTKKKLKIVMIASESVPYAKTGGLADVVGSLPSALQELGNEVIVILPKYSSINPLRFEIKPYLSPLGVWMGDRQEWCSAHAAVNDGVNFYFIEMNKYFDRWGYYHDPNMNDYLDNPRRFGFFTRAALQLCQDMRYKPDILHVHDWQASLGPGYLKIWHWDDPLLGRTASVLTIHNIAYQGVYDAGDFDYLGLQRGNFTPGKFEDHGKINFLKGGIQYADMVNTVSPSFASETRSPAGGHGLAPFLVSKGEDYVGILNGADYTRWDPRTDPYIPHNYSPQDLTGKMVCKRALQERFGLQVNPGIPLIGVTSRFAVQKGLHLLTDIFEQLVSNMVVQFVILGSGDRQLSEFFGGLPARFPGKVGSLIGYDEVLSHWIEAGSDFFLMPSLYEPCGLNQIYSLRYGTLPIVRATGGLDDTIHQYDETHGIGTGFKFWEPSGAAVYYTIGWAVSTYYDRIPHIQSMRKMAMAQDYSWMKSAGQYEFLYERAIKNKSQIR